MRDYGGLDGHKQVLLRARVLQYDCKCVINIAVDPAVGPEKCGHGRRGAEQMQCLIDRVRACPISSCVSLLAGVVQLT